MVDYCAKNATPRFVKELMIGVDRIEDLKRFRCRRPSSLLFCLAHTLSFPHLLLPSPCVSATHCHTLSPLSHTLWNSNSGRYVEMDTGKDQGLNVREKASKLCELLANSDRLKEERDKAKIARERFHKDGGAGLSSDDFRQGKRDWDDDWDTKKKSGGFGDDDDDWGSKGGKKKEKGFGDSDDEGVKYSKPKSKHDDSDDDWGEEATPAPAAGKIKMEM